MTAPTSAAPQPISLGTALWRGFTMRCPHCGAGRLFGRYLKVAGRCAECGEDFSHHRADDFPAYLVILVIGHIAIPAVLIVEELFAPPTWVQLAIWLPLILISALALLQPTKGTIVALQWAFGMHGFAQAKQRRDAATQASAARLVDAAGNA